MNKHLAKIYASIAFILGFIMASLHLAESYSQLADTKHEWLLYAFLGAVVMACMERKQEYDRETAIMFIMVGVFSVNSESKWVETLHMIFTGLAILTAYVSMIASSETKLMRGLGYGTAATGTVLFLLGFWFFWWSIGASELLVLTTLIIPFYKK